jgi:hypothetical protein
MARKGGKNGRDSCDMPFHYIFTGSLTSGANAQLLTPALFPRVGTEADAWAHFRVKKLAFRHLKHLSTLNGPQVAAFVGGVQDSPPATVAAASEVLSSAYLGEFQTVHSEWVHVTKAELAGPFPWYKTVAGAADPSEESPGYFSVVGPGSDSFYIEFRGTFCFKVSLATANTPVALDARRRIREERVANVVRAERDVLLKILSTAPTAGVVKLNP